jgi:hypothetical protein
LKNFNTDKRKSQDIESNAFSKSIKSNKPDNKPRHFLKNWRPISLLNTVYKIGSGVIASRLKRVLEKLIDLDQTGFISGRYIGK